MIEVSLAYLISGLLLGAGSGITPGPLNTLIISESLKHGQRSGIKIALAPILTDGVIILYSVLLVKELSRIHYLIGIITILGAVFIMYLGVKDILGAGAVKETITVNNNSLFKGVITNIFTPYPHIFWITIGAPILIKAYSSNIYGALFFIIGFYSMLIGFKIALALFTDRMKNFLKENIYKVTIKVLGALLIIFGIILFYEGIKKIF